MTDAAATANDARTPVETPAARDLFSKFDPLIAEREALLATGVRDPFAIVMDEVKSPTQAVIKGKDTILLGTYNYMGMTFDPDVVAAGKKALDDFGAGTTGSRVLNGTYQGAQAGRGRAQGLLRHQRRHGLFDRLSGESWHHFYARGQGRLCRARCRQPCVHL